MKGATELLVRRIAANSFKIMEVKMSKLRSIHRVLWVLVLVTLFLDGCGYAIQYNLNKKDIFLAKSTKPLKVQVATFSDKRDVVEREKSVRKEKGDTDLRDYTYDKEFRGDVAEEITKMLITHFNYSKVFASEIMPASFRSEQLSAEVLDSLGEMGIDAVITGEINHFYGYYDRNVTREFLYIGTFTLIAGPPVWFFTMPRDPINPTFKEIIVRSVALFFTGFLGSYPVLYLESLHKRDIEYETELIARIISTSTHTVIWEDSFKIFSSEQISMPGLSTAQGKFQVTVWSLRDVVNQMVKSLEKASFSKKAE